MDPPIAYFLTWTTHGSWLHGDERGSRERPRVNRLRQHLSAPALKAHEQQMGDTEVMLDAAARGVVAEAIAAHCQFRGWPLHALNVRTNHVHLVVTANTAPERVLSQLKAWATRRLREHGLATPTNRVWTRHGSTRWINDHASLEAAIDYVKRHQD